MQDRCVFLCVALAIAVLHGCTPSPNALPADEPTGSVEAPARTPEEPPIPAQQPVENTAATEEDEFEFFEAGEDSPAPQLLSEFNFFSDMAGQIPNSDVVRYELNTEHFADYARVRRFVHIPAGTQIPYTDHGVLDFPRGTVLMQTFSYPQDLRNPDVNEHLVETRVLRLLASGWDGVAYLWNKEGTDARRALAGGIVDVAWTGADGAPHTLKYVVLNKNDCKRCHENEGVMLAIGPLIANLNRECSYENTTQNQLANWSERGILKGAPANPVDMPRLSRWDDPSDASAEVRARAWLQVNCAHCHNPHGAGGVSGLDLRLLQDNPIRLGIYKPPIAAGRGSEGNRYSIEPGKPESSFLVGRLLSVDPSVMMPPIGRRQSQTEAVALVSEWISMMHFDVTEAEQLKSKQRELLQYVQREGKWPETLPE